MKRQLLPAVDVRLPRRGRLKDEPGASRGAADAVPLVELQVGELEDEFFQRLGLRLRRGAVSEGSRSPSATKTGLTRLSRFALVFWLWGDVAICNYLFCKSSSATNRRNRL